MEIRAFELGLGFPRRVENSGGADLQYSIHPVVSSEKKKETKSRVSNALLRRGWRYRCDMEAVLTLTLTLIGYGGEVLVLQKLYAAVDHFPVLRIEWCRIRVAVRAAVGMPPDAHCCRCRL